MDGLAIAFSAAFGLLIGSFLNVVIYRVPRDLSIVKPGSQCPGCHHAIAWHDNIPVVSWLVLRGRCRHCDTRISARYPLIEAFTGALFAVMAAKFGWHWELPAFLVFAAVLVAVSAIDLELKRIPTPIVWTGLLMGVTLILVATLATQPHHWWPVVRGLIGAVACGAGLFLIGEITKGMGLGDARLVTFTGFFLGWLGAGLPVVGLFFGFLIGSVVGVALIVTRKAGRKTKIPFGPFLAAGALVAVFWGQPLLRLYSRG